VSQTAAAAAAVTCIIMRLMLQIGMVQTTKKEKNLKLQDAREFNRNAGMIEAIKYNRS